MDTIDRTGIEEVLTALGSRAAIGRVCNISKQAANQLVDKGYVIATPQREHLLRLKRACPHVSIAALCGIAEPKQEAE